MFGKPRTHLWRFSPAGGGVVVYSVGPPRSPFPGMDRLRGRRASPIELVDESLRAIETTEPAINAFVRATADLAPAQAREAEAIVMGKSLGPLHGVPVSGDHNAQLMKHRTDYKAN